MRTATWILFASAVLAVAGCNDKNRAGGPGVTASDRSKTLGTADATFELDPPNLTTNVKQGESKVISIGIKRGKNFDQDVKLSFENVPNGVVLDPLTPTIKKSDTETKITVKAADDAALGKYELRITGTPTTGAAASNTVKINVEKK